MFRTNSLPILRQAQLSECGHVCIAMISAYHGHQIDLHALRKIEEPTINGTTLINLIQILEQLKFRTRAIRVEMNDLQRIQCPAILHWNMNHFVVLKSIHSKYAIIHDPAFGKRKVSMSELSTAFTGIALEIEKSQNFTLIKSSRPLRFLDILKGIKGLKQCLIALLILSLTIELFALVNPIFMQYITDNVLGSSSLNNLYVVALGFILLTCFHTLTEYFRSHFTIYLTNTVTEYFSSGVMSHLLKLPFEYFERRHKGDILSRFHSINEIQSKVTTDSITTLLDGIVLILVLIIMLIYSLTLTAIIILSVTGYFLLRLASYNYLKNQTEISITEHAKQSSKFLEAIQSIMAIKLYSKESTLFREWKNAFIRGMNADVHIAKANILYHVATLFLFNIENLLVITLGAVLVIKNQYSLGMLLAFLSYRHIFVSKITAFIQKVFEYSLVSIQIERVSDILLHPTESEDKETVVKPNIKGDIKIEHLSYHYPGSQHTLLSDIHLHIPHNEKVVITGPSGIGKTTLLKILLGLIAPTEGKILIDEVPLDLLGVKKYRSLCASVMQDDTLISGSILDNISFLDTKIDIDKVYQAAKIAHIHETILNMPMGYETLIGDMGSSLSGGQKQRVLLARALYKNPKILFLDEATSHLDVETEIKINQALKELKITQIIIAHREESIKMADRIIQLG